MLVGASIMALLTILWRKSPRPGLQHLRLPLTEAASRRMGWRLPGWCQKPGWINKVVSFLKCGGLLTIFKSIPTWLGSKLKEISRILCCGSCVESDTNGRVPWRQRAQNARQSLLQAQEQMDVALGEAQIRLSDALKRAERAEAESKQLRKFLQESNTRVDVAESIAKKCRNETEELKVSFRRAEETATKARR
eukprot:symbB.v1.2.022011.t1/scaffold1935.1/size95652/6